MILYLYNIIIIRSPRINLNPTYYTGRSVRDGDLIRKQFTNYFINEGELKWQYKMI